MKKIPSLSQPLASLLIAVIGFFIVAGLQVSQLRAWKNQPPSPDSETLQKEVNSTKYRLDLLEKFPTLGFDNLVADWVFLEFAGYFGDDEARNVTGYNTSLEYFETIINKDPRFMEAYPFLFASVVTYGGMPKEAQALMEEGLKSMTPQTPAKSYYIWRYKAFTELLYLGDVAAAKESHSKAAEWASTHSDDRSQIVAQLSRRTAKNLESNPNSKAAQISSWLGVLETAVDDNTRQKALNRIQELGGKVEVSPEGNVKVKLPQE